jgi:hypothetical protein
MVRVEWYNPGCGPTTHSTGADVAWLLSTTWMPFDDSSGPVNSSVRCLVNLMKLNSRVLLLLGLLLLPGEANLFANLKFQQRSVPKDFSYPEASETVEIESSAKSLSGIVKSPNGDVLSDVLVERVGSDWKNRLDATLTNSKGKFALSNLPEGKYYLKVSKSGFSTLLVKVILKKKAKSRLEFALPLGI